jgi:hypothetical protein
VYVWFDDSRAVDREATYRLLSGSSWQATTSVAATVHEVFDGIYGWLALHADAFFQLGVNEPALRDVSCIVQIPGKLGLTAGLYTDAGMAILGLGVDDHAAWNRDDAECFDIRIRSFGPDPAVARELGDLVRRWDVAGRPGSSTLHIRAYAIDEAYRGSPGEFIVDKRWSRLVLSW